MTPTPIPMQPDLCNRKQHQSIRLFENELLERLSHVHPITPLLMWGPIAGWLLWRSFSLYQLPGYAGTGHRAGRRVYLDA